MSDLLKDWTPSQATVEVIKLNEIDDEHIAKTVEYLKKSELNHIDEIDGYDNWNSFFIIFCIKAHRNVNGEKEID